MHTPIQMDSLRAAPFIGRAGDGNQSDPRYGGMVAALDETDHEHLDDVRVVLALDRCQAVSDERAFGVGRQQDRHRGGVGHHERVVAADGNDDVGSNHDNPSARRVVT